MGIESLEFRHARQHANHPEMLQIAAARKPRAGGGDGSAGGARFGFYGHGSSRSSDGRVIAK
jgi:hypothetical protein